MACRRSAAAARRAAVCRRGSSPLARRAQRGRPRRAIRALDTPIIGRIDDDRFLLDLRTVREEEDEEIALAFRGMDDIWR